MADYTTLAKVKEFLGITDILKDAKLTSLISRVTAIINSYTSRFFDQQTITNEILEVTEDEIKLIFPKNYPIISVTSITEDDVALVENTDFYVYSTFIKRNGYWLKKPKAIKITYVAGYVTVPADIEQVEIEMVGILAGEKIKTFTTNEGVEQTVLITSMPTYLKEILDLYAKRKIS